MELSGDQNAVRLIRAVWFSLLDSLPESSGLPWQRDQNQREANAESFLIRNCFSLTPESARRPFWVSLRTFDQRCSLCPRRLGGYRRLGEIPQQVVRRPTILEPREETMKIRLLLALAGLAIGYAVPAFAQEKDAV